MEMEVSSRWKTRMEDPQLRISRKSRSPGFGGWSELWKAKDQSLISFYRLTSINGMVDAWMKDYTHEPHHAIHKYIYFARF